ncbi:hypothetical protein MTR72_03480 [Bradyrhizobium sp. ISRA442]|uniref:hypothetical protein n=1 Tax=Bradyrhizobium sp. ISRA442 TaxID=2866197 RepID=UPI00311AF930
MRVALGKPPAEQGSVREDITHSFCEIAHARLLTLQASGPRRQQGHARPDRRGQDRGAEHGRARDRPRHPDPRRRRRLAGLVPARAYVYARFIRIGDGPDQVHLAAIGKELIKRGGVMAG